eukprot:TRINITY_DN421_c0_g1_i1.p1 TRINITY_DN421_c0_g1~~TRINITY_DN421_c0_g1_i1.p1  ORF type:complete len:502 (+),score=116.31 TRINITY_DN421_c0_g1_i1:18-1523(+)
MSSASSSSASSSSPSIDQRLADAKALFAKHGQEHVFRFVNEKTSDEEKRTLLNEVQGIDVAHLVANYALVEKQAESQKKDVVTPFSDRVTESMKASTKERDKWVSTAMHAIASGQVGLILMAGGQGTRLGFNKPKGCFDIGLPSHKCLFQLQAERILRLKHLASVHTNAEESKISIPWYIMTSFQTDTETRSYLQEHKYFGLPENDVVFFSQANLPCLTKEGKILLESKYQFAKAPDGNGGVYHALAQSGVLKDMKKRGVLYTHFYGVDNALVKVADPLFIGYCITQGADCCNKVVLKTDPKEKVGVMCYRNKRPAVIEYSELAGLAEQRDKSTGQLLYSAANIANHFFSVAFLDSVAKANNLPFHIAEKKIPCADEKGVTTTPAKANGIKLEMFVFDAFLMATNMWVLAVPREGEFTAVKNASGTGIVDSPATARQDVSDYHKKLWSAAGGKFQNDAKDLLFEISPLVSGDGEGLEAWVKKLSPIKLPFNLSVQECRSSM